MTTMTVSRQTGRGAWGQRLAECLPLYGHRNWIVVADAAYPAQARPGIETIVADADQIATVRTVLDAISACRHIRANIYTDAEIGYVEEGDASGISAYRRQLDSLLGGSTRNQLPHEEIIARLDRSAEMFRILIVKTDMIIPYTSVFFELDCGYWNAEAEGRLRGSMKASQGR
jgi:L-fucose mutarotase/ribose pyranase (RbsD/FucU family)